MNGLVVTVSSAELFNIMLTYYPKNIVENFTAFIVYDDVKNENILNDIHTIIKEHDIPLFNNVTIINKDEIIDFYLSKYKCEGTDKKFLYQYPCHTQILIPAFIFDKFKITKLFTSDDDVLILRDLSYLFSNNIDFSAKKDSLYYLRTNGKYDILNAFNQIFNSNFTLDEINALPFFAGNLVLSYDDKLLDYFDRFLKSKYVQYMYYDHEGYTSWTISQRFFHFYMHKVMTYPDKTTKLMGPEMRFVLSLSALDKTGDGREFKQSVPTILHYAIGVKKPLFMRKFLPGIAWRYNDFQYQPKYEWHDILYNENWTPTKFSKVQKDRDNKILTKNKPIF